MSHEDVGIHDTLDGANVQKHEYLLVDALPENTTFNSFVDEFCGILDEMLPAKLIDALPEVWAKPSHVVEILFAHPGIRLSDERPEVVHFLDEIDGRIHNLFHFAQHADHLPFGNGINEVIFAREILVHRLLADAQLIDEFVHCDLGEAHGVEPLAAGLKDPLSHIIVVHGLSRLLPQFVKNEAILK